MNETNQLLRTYAEANSETAFRELVERYVDLVYSVAIRRTGGDTHRAEDIVQTVFTDLARKAADLPPNVQLGGWLHRHCCFVASNAHRSETRRVAREREAMALFDSNAAPGEPSWEELAPELDEAIQDLQEADREALVMRYFEKRDLRSVGSVLGITEDAAQKRVSRALDKLRELLLQRGVALSVVALTSYLASQSVSAAPTAWAAKISARAIQQISVAPIETVAAGGMALLLGSSAFKMGALVAAIALSVGTLLWQQKKNDPNTSTAPNTTRVVQKESSQSAAASAIVTLANSQPDTASLAEDTNSLQLILVAKDTGAPIVNGRIDYRGFEGERFTKRELVTDAQGTCRTSISREALTDLELTTRIEGFADTRLKWWPRRGDKIPLSYTLKLDRAVRIGGQVVNEQGQAIEGAKVGFNHDDAPEEAMRTENHMFSWIEVETDQDGRWSMDRIANEMIRRLRGSASHTDYVGSTYLQLSEHPEAEKDLRAGTHRFTLGTAATVRGIVTDQSALPIVGAKVLIGPRGMTGSRETTTELDGTFKVQGCKPGKSLITAEAPQYAPTTIAAEISLAATEPYTLILQAGRILRLLVVNRSGEPVSHANVWLNTMESGPRSDTLTPLVQTEFAPLTDADGRVFWDQAPDRELAFDIQGKGYMRASGVKIQPDGAEHTVTLKPALKLRGTVIDDKTGQPIPKFKVVAGWPQRTRPDDTNPKAHWSPLDRYWLSFSDGKFEYSWDEPVLYGTPEVEYIFKIEAEGYAAFVTRVVNATEENVHFDVRLKPASDSLISVLTPNGAPAVNADVVLAAPGQYIELGANGFSRGNGGVFRATDEKGQFSLSPDESVVKIYAASPEGFAEVTPNALLESGTLQLQAWGRIEGIFSKRGKGLGDKKIVLGPTSHDPADSHLRLRPAVSTDAEGRFTFQRAPAGKFQLAYLSPDSGGVFTHVPFATVALHPGETVVINHDENGVDIALRVLWPSNFKRDPKLQIMAMVHTPFPQPPAEIAGNPQALQAWARSPEMQELSSKAKHYSLHEAENGLWKGDEIQAGAYLVSFNIFIPGENGAPVNPLLVANTQITIPQPTEASDETLDVGTVQLAAPPSSPTPGRLN